MKLNMNKKYTTIAVYAFLVIAAAITFFFVISEHSVVGRMAGTFFGLMTPFIYGAALAYVLNPVLNWLEKKVFPKVFGDRVSKRSRRGLGVLLTFLFGSADSTDCREHRQPGAVDLRLFAAGAELLKRPDCPVRHQ